MHWTLDHFLTSSGQAVCKKANVRVGGSRHSLEFLQGCWRKKLQRMSRASHMSSMQLEILWSIHRKRVYDVSNKRQMQKWKSKKNTNISGWKSGAVHIDDTEEDVERAFGDRGRRRCRVLSTETHDIHRWINVTSCCCLLHQPSLAHCSDVCVCVNATEQRISCCVVHMWNGNPEESLDPIVQTFSGVHVWKRKLIRLCCLICSDFVSTPTHSCFSLVFILATTLTSCLFISQQW